MVILYGTVLNQDNTPVRKSPVTIDVLPAAKTANGVNVKTIRVLTNDAGYWSVDLTPNRFLVPEQTYYRVRTHFDVTNVQIPHYEASVSIDAAEMTPPLDKFWESRKTNGRLYKETPWVSLSLNVNMQAVPAHPVETRAKPEHETVRIRGAMEHVGPSNVPADTTLATLPTGHRPEQEFNVLGLVRDTGGGVVAARLTLKPDGTITSSRSFPPGDILYFDNITFTMEAD